MVSIIRNGKKNSSLILLLIALSSPVLRPPQAGPT
jgi:hypothetical protein